ncbi:serum response factor-binding protein 1 [Syngnathoides biaculeatus]|uniref:serum response factor-binding protein 1 n=1 Tax=Syngnathoides biaculeatus TaxID=300417 RepID=UPI002ADD87B0|nr:serum response factor-binding protein 1 [Syngnathoides biaculeatus]
MTTSNDSAAEMACEKEAVGNDSHTGDVEEENKEQKQEDVREAGGEIEDGTEKEEAKHVEGEDCGEEEEKKDEAGQPREEMEKEPDHVEAQKQPAVLNLNNEVVNMRKEVKRVRALLSRKLIRQIAGLKKKKGKEADVEKNQRRAARLLEEIHAMKVLKPDLVTKTALQKNLNFNEVCKNPNSTMSDRAIARIASHPQFKTKIENIQAAVKAFRDERRKGGKQGERKGKNEAGKVAQSSPVKPKKVQEMVEEEKNSEVGERTNDDESDPKDQASSEPDEDEIKPTQAPPAAKKKAAVETKIVKAAPVKKSVTKEQVKKKKPQVKAQENKRKVVSESIKEEEEESDLELSDEDEEDKPYFDDSTEERFHKQSSQEESDSDNDFFVGKVCKFKKKKSKNTQSGGDTSKDDAAGKFKTDDKLQRELDELESRLKAKGPKLQTVFCSLSQTKPSRGGRGKPVGRGHVDFDKHIKFQKEQKGPTGLNKSNGPHGRRSETERGNLRGRGRGDARRQQDRPRPGGFSNPEPQQALHPSWEASKKRKEQQGQILAFQGKKIKFDDDD